MESVDQKILIRRDLIIKLNNFPLSNGRKDFIKAFLDYSYSLHHVPGDLRLVSYILIYEQRITRMFKIFDALR